MVTAVHKGRKPAIFACAFLIPFLMMQIFWIICRIHPFGGNSILTGDMDIEFVNFYAYFINTFKTKNDWSYMFAKTLGGDFPGLAAFQLHDPLLLILFFFPGDKIATGIELMFSLQISIAGLSAAILLNNRYKASWMSLLFSTAYAFSGFFFGYLVLTIYFGALAILPLVIYYFLKFLDDEKGFIGLVVTASLFIYINYHVGFMLVIFMSILYISRMIADTRYIKRIRSLFMAGITVIMIDGFFLIRTGLSLIGEKTTDGADYGLYRRFPMNQLFAGMFSGCARSDLRPLIYCSVAAFFFAVLYFISPKIRIREKLANAFVIAAVAVSMWINLLDTVWHGFNNPEGFYWRYAYYISITVIVLGYKGLITLLPEAEGMLSAGETVTEAEVMLSAGETVTEAEVMLSAGETVTESEEIKPETADYIKKYRRQRDIRAIIYSAVILLFYLAWLRVSGNEYLDMERLVINIGLVVAIALLTVLMTADGMRICRSRKAEQVVRIAGFGILSAISVADMLYSSKTSYLALNSNNGTLPAIEEFKEEYRDISEVISYIKSEDDGFYRIEKDFDRAINDPAMFDYIGLSHDSSCEKDELINWLLNFGFCKTVYYTYYNGGSTTFVDDFFGIKYFVSRFDGIAKPYKKMDYKGKFYAYSNENALPMAYIAPEGLEDCDIREGNTFEKQNRIASYWSDDPIYLEAEYDMLLEGAEEKDGKFVKTAEEGYVIYNIRITEKMPLYFYFYAPERQNAEVFVNGKSRDLYFTVNHWNTLCAGFYKPGDILEIKLKILDDGLEISDACFYYEDAEALAQWGKAADAYNEPIGEAEEITSSKLRFEIASDKAETVMMSIPYDDAWKIKCDGKRIEGRAAIEQLMSFEVPNGRHEIEMKYIPKGTLPGITVSLLGILLFGFQIVYKRRRSYM
ncbi:MAG: YfhO family protein [Lachnospiraceae bacterium]|nr:YfhO family protein [Lachnospiraceae bacterium]